jgi:hypothetical protein
MQPYEYSELTDPGELRLLILAPGGGSAPLGCRLKHTILSNQPIYEALSYAWGDPTKAKEIICEDRSISITESLFTALRHLRHVDEERTIWADAVCIDQSSDSEKNHQLALMGMIYSKAARTIVWLGEDTTGSAAAAFHQIAYLFNNVLKGGLSNQEICEGILNAHQQDGWGNFDDWYMHFIDTIAPIFGSPYFYRLWVVQEFALSRNTQLVFGTEAMSMFDFVSIFHDLAGLEQGSQYQERYNFHALCNLLDMDSIRSSLQGRSKTNNATSRRLVRFPQLLDIIFQTERQLFTDPRDRIYAILSLTQTPGFSADYTLTIEETFLRFASWALASFPGLALLSVARGVSPTKFKIPSWALAPDMAGLDTVELKLGPWDTPPRMSCMPPTGLPVSFLHVGHFMASGISHSEPEAGGHSFWSIGTENELQLKGCVVDSIQRRGNRWMNTATLVDKRQSLLEAIMIATWGTSEFEGERYRRFCAAMTFELSIKHARALPIQHQYFDNYLHRITRVAEVQVEGGTNMDYDFVAIHGEWARYRFFCLTTSDRFAWVPQLAQKGDKICVVQGSRIPYVLRPQPDGKFILVGECWIQGLMEGHALDLPGFKWQDIYLI